MIYVIINAHYCHNLGSIFTYVPALLVYQNFPTIHQGKIVGILNCGFGLSAAIFSGLYQIAFAANTSKHNQNLSGFLLLLGCVMVGANILGALIINITRAPYQSVTEIQENLVPEECTNRWDSITSSYGTKGPLSNASSAHSQAIWKSLIDLDFWILFICFTIIQGVGLLYINNISFLADSVSESHWTSIVTVILPLSNSLSRVIIGFVSDYYQSIISRGALFFLVNLIMGIGQMIIFLFMKQVILGLYGNICNFFINIGRNTVI